MAFSKHRFRDLSGGQSGFGFLAVYDGRGQGGDNRATIITPGFFTDPEVLGAAQRGMEAVPGTGTGNGRFYPILVLANDGFSVEPFWYNPLPPLPTPQSPRPPPRLQHDSNSAFAIA